MCTVYINICYKSEEGPDRVRTELCNNGCTYYCSMHYNVHCFMDAILSRVGGGVGGRGKHLFIYSNQEQSVIRNLHHLYVCTV
jgi:hypothetical protein